MSIVISYESFGSLLKNIVDNRGKTCPTTDKGIALIATNCIVNNHLYPLYEKVRYVSEEVYKSWFRDHPKPGDMIFVLKGTPGRVAWVPDPVDFCIAQDMVAIRADEKKIYPKYLFAVLRSDLIQQEIESLHVGSLIPHFKKSDFDDLKIPIVEPKLQEYIGNLYFDISLKIDLLHRQNKTLEAMAETLFRQWFVEEADEGWEEGSIYELIDVIYGYPFSSVYFNEEKRGLPLVRIRDLKNGFSNVYTDEKCDDKYIINCGDLVAGMDGEFKLYIWAGEQSLLNQRLCKFIPKFDFVPQLFVYELMKPHLYYFENVKVGTTVIHLCKADLDDIRSSIPPKDILIKFGEVVNPFYNKLKNNYKQIRILEKLRDTLLPKLMSGEVRVNV